MIVDSPRQQLPYSFAITLHNSRNCHGSHLTGSFFGIEIGWDADVGGQQGLMVKTQQEAVNKVVYVFVCVYISMFGQIASKKRSQTNKVLSVCLYVYDIYGYLRHIIHCIMFICLYMFVNTYIYIKQCVVSFWITFLQDIYSRPCMAPQHERCWTQLIFLATCHFELL